jgi:hypothetical protein
MNIGRFGPEPIRWYLTPIIADLPYEQITKDPFPTPQEARVSLRLGDKIHHAYVPLTIVDESTRTVKAALMGQQADMVFVSFPPTNFGQTRFFSTSAALAQYAET